jgi:hypothetical protein
VFDADRPTAVTGFSPRTTCEASSAPKVAPRTKGHSGLASRSSAASVTPSAGKKETPDEGVWSNW